MSDPREPKVIHGPGDGPPNPCLQPVESRASPGQFIQKLEHRGTHPVLSPKILPIHYTLIRSVGAAFYLCAHFADSDLLVAKFIMVVGPVRDSESLQSKLVDDTRKLKFRPHESPRHPT